MTKYKLLEMDEMGYFNLHTASLSLDEAKANLKRHKNFFPDSTWIIEEENEEDESEEYKEERHYNEKAVDGWEDLFNY
jgi:hypothetical protein